MVTACSGDAPLPVADLAATGVDVGASASKAVFVSEGSSGAGCGRIGGCGLRPAASPTAATSLSETHAAAAASEKTVHFAVTPRAVDYPSLDTASASALVKEAMALRGIVDAHESISGHSISGRGSRDSSDESSSGSSSSGSSSSSSSSSSSNTSNDGRQSGSEGNSSNSSSSSINRSIRNNSEGTNVGATMGKPPHVSVISASVPMRSLSQPVEATMLEAMKVPVTIVVGPAKVLVMPERAQLPSLSSSPSPSVMPLAQTVLRDSSQAFPQAPRAPLVSTPASAPAVIIPTDAPTQLASAVMGPTLGVQTTVARGYAAAATLLNMSKPASPAAVASVFPTMVSVQTTAAGSSSVVAQTNASTPRTVVVVPSPILPAPPSVVDTARPSRKSSFPGLLRRERSGAAATIGDNEEEEEEDPSSLLSMSAASTGTAEAAAEVDGSLRAEAPACSVGEWPEADKMKLEGNWRFRCTSESARVVRSGGVEVRFIPLGAVCTVQCSEALGLKARVDKVKCVRKVKEDRSVEITFEKEPYCEMKTEFYIVIFVILVAIGAVCAGIATWREAQRESFDGDDWR
eukprot:TRINITY_DN27657_c0_g1_i1.p1 TRINITY_DN27657_c0_g1~~TRINITY_DN27657_c0_g1_i1.p1  ORF type:complete len:648 (-),score=135.16 TRINITY_DN27657_c0_g1_i1:53-1777(-)